MVPSLAASQVQGVDRLVEIGCEERDARKLASTRDVAVGDAGEMLVVENDEIRL